MLGAVVVGFAFANAFVASLPFGVGRELTAQADTVMPIGGVRKTAPVELKDVKRPTADLRSPTNIKEEEAYDAEADRYEVGTKLGDTYLNTPFLMSPDEYREWSLRRSMNAYFRQKIAEEYTKNGKEDFSFTDMKFDLGPAEKIFGPGGVRVKTQGSIELKIGANLQSVDNPSLPINRRRTFGFDFDEKINLNLTGSVGDKMKMNLNYNTEATFDFDTKNIKLRYEGKEDEIIKLVEAGNVSLPTNSSLIRGASSLFGIRTDMQFGRLKLQTVVSQKKTSTQTVSSKGGTQLTSFELDADGYESNRHFFLSHFFRDRYDASMAQLPNITSGITINRVEVWITNNSGTTTNTRDIVGFTDLGEYSHISNSIWTAGSVQYPANAANSLYATITTNYADARNINSTTAALGSISGFVGGADFEKLESARKLSSSEYTLNASLGYISLKSTLQSDQVLAVAYEYTYLGNTYQVGEFSTDQTNSSSAIFVKTLKNTSNTPEMGNWDLMMKNVYALGASNIQKEKFKLNIKYLSDSAGVYLTYLNEPALKSTPIIRLIGMDRLDDNNNRNPNGTFDFISGYTIDTSTGRVFFTTVEPFGKTIADAINDPSLTDKYTFSYLYDSLKTIAQQDAEHNKYVITGQYKGTSGSEIQLGATNIPRGSVVVKAGGVTLTENSDYSVDYSMGIVTIINQSILDAGTSVSVSLESESDFSMQRKTMLGMNWQYDFSKNFVLGGTIMHLSEQALTSKVAMGNEPLNNTLWGVNLSWKQQSQWLTNVLNRLPFVNASAPSAISLTAEFAQLIAGKNKGAQDDASYLDDFENSSSKINIASPTEWILSSTPSLFPESQYVSDIRYGYNRALLAWYNIDPLFTRRSSSLTPSHIKSDLAQLSNHYVREIYRTELFPLTQTTYGEPATLSVLNLSYYPSERGPYNLDPDLDTRGRLSNPQNRWGGMMRKIETTDFETSNIEYIEFWLLDPFIYTRGTGGDYSGDLYFNLGDISEDVLHDGQKFSESDMPLDGDTTQTFAAVWGRVPIQKGVTYAFNTGSNTREYQDVGYNGLRSADELTYGPYAAYLDAIRSRVSTAVYDSIAQDPAGDDYHYFRGSDYDRMAMPILDRYKRINMPEGNSVDSENSPESYSTTYKTTPDVEDINSDYTLNEYERYYQYRVRINPDSLVVGRNYIVDSRTYRPSLRDNTPSDDVTWYQFRIPVDEFESKVGTINDFSNIRFVRMFMTGFKEPIVLRLATLDLVRGEWRNYDRSLNNEAGASSTGSLVSSTVSLEENSNKTPVNYTLPPGISRVVDPSQSQIIEQNEAALSLIVKDMSSGEARAVYKKMNLDLRNYKRISMFAHANALAEGTELIDNQVSMFIRFGTDYNNNYYEYEIPLAVTPAGSYSDAQRTLVWPEANNFDIALSLLTDAKKARNRAKSLGTADYNSPYHSYDPERPSNRITVMGNPSLGDVRTMMIGVRNNSNNLRDAEVWVNELRLQDYANDGGWAARANLNVQLSDVGSVNMTGQVETAGFGGIEDRISSRRQDDLLRYGITASFELGRFVPSKLKLQAPVYYSYSRERTTPLYNPLDTDIRLEDALDALLTDAERDSLRNIAITNIVNRNFSISNARFNVSTKGRPMPYDPANFSFGYAHSHQKTTGETTAWETEDTWKWTFGYNYSPVYKGYEPFAKMKSNSKWLRILRELSINYIPQNVAFNSEMTRYYYELQERDVENLDNATSIPLVWSSTFLWRRSFNLRWDLTKNIQASFASATNAEIEMPYTAVNKNLYPDEYVAWKDSVWKSILSLGTPLNYQQTFNASYNIPLSKIPAFAWITASNITFASTYSWTRGYTYEDGSTLGNTIANSRNISGRAEFNLETLYNLVPFLQKANRRFSSSASTAKKTTKDEPKNFEKEIQLLADTTQILQHNRASKKIRLTAIRQNGERFPLKYKVLDANRILVLSQDTVKLKVTVAALPANDTKAWYKALQTAARTLMMLRNVSITYNNAYSMSLPGFTPDVGDIFGQKSANGLQPGLGFAFGLTGDGFIQSALERGWLLTNDSISTPATTNLTENLQISARVEPFRDFRITLNASRMVNKARSIQYMYEGMPATQSGSFSMTTISIGSAFEGIGNVNNGYRSKAFEKFAGLLDAFRDRFEARYAGALYPTGSTLAGQAFDPANGTVSKYSADVMIPAFLSAYTGGSSLDIFPALTRLLPNWSVTYSGLSKLAFMKGTFKAFNINHTYRSIYSVGSYNSYASYKEVMDGLGFVSDATTGSPVPSSMFDISTVSISESFSPLLGVDMTFHNNLTARLEYRKTRVLSLSMTSYQINESGSSDFVIGLGYKLNDVKLFESRSRRRTTAKKTAAARAAASQSGTATTTPATTTSGFNNSLTMQLDFSLRNQSAVNRDISTLTSTATSGNKALKISFVANYVLSRLMTLSAYYDRQQNTPLLTSSSYPTTTQDFGISFKFSLTR